METAESSPAIRSESLSDGSMVFWDPGHRDARWIHGDPIAVER